MYSVGIDIGGTFTDFFILSDAGQVTTFKTHTMPADPVRGVVLGLTDVAAMFGTSLEIFLADTLRIVHGTTVATNAILTGQGVKTALLTTGGFRDALEMRRGHRPQIFDNVSPPPAPLVPRSLRTGVTERIDAEGRVEIPLALDEVRRALRAFREQGVKAVAVSLLFSFLNRVHEKMIAQCAEQEFPDLYLSVSSQILPEIGEYERTSTVVVNSYVGPIIASYLNRLERELRARGFAGTLLLMQSNGGVESVISAQSKPVTLILSGPASGPSAGAYYCAAYGIDKMITIDMGGTSFDACLLSQGAPALIHDGEMSGHRIATPMVDVHVVGAGGGSIAWLDTAELLRVGPKSAGALPGPACYGTGGVEATVTDADVVLGYLDPQFFLGGRVILDREAALRAIETRIASRLGLDVIEAAWGIVRVVTSNMAESIEKISVRKGHDPREFCLLVGGGAGPTHAGMIAHEMEIRRILIPQSASVLCAFGMLASTLKHCYVRTYTFRVSALRSSRAGEIWREMRREALETLLREGAGDPDSVRFTYSADMRYMGQVYDLEVGLDETDACNGEPEHVADRFHQAHEAIYGYADPSVDVECVNLRLTATTARAKVELPGLRYVGEDPSPAHKGNRAAYFDGKGLTDTPVFDGARVACGNVVEGPALIERQDTTVVVPPGFRLRCDEWGNYRMSPVRTNNE